MGSQQADEDPDRFAFFNNDVGMTLTTFGGDYVERRNPQAWRWYQSGLIEWIGTYAGDSVYPHTGELFVGTLGGTWILPAPYPGQNPAWEKA